jgi:hypothetical protein
MLRDYEDWKQGSVSDSIRAPSHDRVDSAVSDAHDSTPSATYEPHSSDATYTAHSAPHRENAWASPEPAGVAGGADDDIAAFFRAREAMKRA